MKLTNIISNAKVIPNLATITLISIALGWLPVQKKKRERVPEPETRNANIYPALSPNLR